MTVSSALVVKIRDAIEQVEESYEFMLAYAAQGRKQEPEAEGASQIRSYLERFASALTIINDSIPGLFESAEGEAFRNRFQEDVATMQAIVNLLLSNDSISSDMVDNTNGLICVRSCLTDLFFVDQVMLPSRSAVTS